MSSSGSGSDDEDGGSKPAPKLVYKAEHSLFVRNLSPQVSETIVRDVFAECDEIEKVTFRAYPNSNSQFFAQIDFASSKGVTEGSKLSGVDILGVPCEVGVVDPVISAHNLRVSAAAGGDGAPMDLGEGATNEEVLKRVREASEDQRLRTVHVANLADETTPEMLKRLCEKFGDIERLKIDRDVTGAAFGLVEFRERGPAHICKMQGKFLVDGRVITCTEAKSMVDEGNFMEQMIQFQAPILDAMGMRNILTQQSDLKDKLDQVRAAAMELVSKQQARDEAAADEGSLGQDATAQADQAEPKRSKKDKAEKKEKKLKKKEKKRKEKEAKKKKKKKEKRKAKKRRGKDPASGKPLRRRKLAEDAADGEAAEEGEEESVAQSVSESPDGPVDLDSEVELVGNLPPMVLGTSSSDSSSSDDAGAGAATSGTSPRRRGSAAAVPPRPRPPASVAELIGRWMVGGDPNGMWTVGEGGAALFQGRKVNVKWDLSEERRGRDLVIFSRGQREAGWELDLASSTADRLVWKKASEPDAVWERQAEAAPGAAAPGETPGAAAAKPNALAKPAAAAVAAGAGGVEDAVLTVRRRRKR